MLGWRPFAAGLTVAVLCAAGLGAEPAPPRLQGTFLQLWSTHGTWTEETWRRLFGYLERLRVTELVVQWSVYADIAFYPSERHTPVPQPPLSTILRLAAQRGMTVLVGLASDPAFWSKVTREPALVQSYLRASRARSSRSSRHIHRSRAGISARRSRMAPGTTPARARSSSTTWARWRRRCIA